MSAKFPSETPAGESSGTVPADDSYDLACFNLEVDVVESPELLVVGSMTSEKYFL